MRVILFCLVLLGGALAFRAQAVEDADRQAMRQVIERQIEAFRRDDAAAAYAFAAPAIQRIFPTDEIFLSMVRQGYRPVYRQRSLQFGEMRDGPEGPMQIVQLQDEDGVDWVALYTFERQPDGAWRIAGCVLLKAPGQPA